MSAAADPYTFISFAWNPWREVRQTFEHVMARLAREHQVLYCSRRFSWRTIYGKLLEREPIGWRTRQLSPTLVDVPPWLWLRETPRWPALDRALHKLHVAQVRSALARRGWDNRILYIWHPDMLDMAGCLDERLVCFHCYDDYAGYFHLPDRERRRVSTRLKRLLDRADLVFAAGEAMRAGLDRRDVHVVQNGVDYELFATARTHDWPVPAELAGVPRPIVAHVGRLGIKIDFALLAEIARRRRDWSVVLLGPLAPVLPRDQRAHCDALLAEPNVTHIPAKPVVELPRYLRHVDVGLMAYRMMGWVVRGFPLKLFEYLAAGKPCVGPPLEENIRYRDYVTIAESPDEWIAAIEHWLANDSEQLADARMALASKNSWDVRCRQIVGLIDERLGAGHAGVTTSHSRERNTW